MRPYKNKPIIVFATTETSEAKKIKNSIRTILVCTINVLFINIAVEFANSHVSVPKNYSCSFVSSSYSEAASEHISSTYWSPNTYHITLQSIELQYLKEVQKISCFDVDYYSKMPVQIVSWTISGNLEEVEPRKIKDEIVTAMTSLALDTNLERWSDHLKFQLMDVNEDAQGNTRNYGFQTRQLHTRWGHFDADYQPQMHLRSEDVGNNFFHCIMAAKKDFIVQGHLVTDHLLIEFIGTYDWDVDPRLLA